MRIGLIGGIYGKDDLFRRDMPLTPETLLEQGCRRRGHEVEVASHYGYLNSGDFDIVHVHHLGFGALRAGADSSRAACVYTSHDGPAMMGLPAGRLQKLASHWVMSRADAVIALSQAEAAFQRGIYGLSSIVHKVIPNGIDAERYHYGRRNHAGKGSPWQLLYVGQLIPSKRVDLLLQSLRLVPQTWELKLVYQVATLADSLGQLAADLGLAERVRFVGSLRPDDLRALYQQADLFIFPSAAEALPSVVTESMFCGTPVVATDVGGVREQLGGYGIVVPPGEVGALATAIADVLEHYEFFADQGEMMSKYAQTNFSADKMVERHLELYAGLLGASGPRRRQRAFRAPVNAVVNLGVALLCATR